MVWWDRFGRFDEVITDVVDILLDVGVATCQAFCKAIGQAQILLTDSLHSTFTKRGLVPLHELTLVIRPISHYFPRIDLHKSAIHPLIL